MHLLSRRRTRAQQGSPLDLGRMCAHDSIIDVQAGSHLPEFRISVQVDAAAANRRQCPADACRCSVSDLDWGSDGKQEAAVRHEIVQLVGFKSRPSNNTLDVMTPSAYLSHVSYVSRMIRW